MNRKMLLLAAATAAVFSVGAYGWAQANPSASPSDITGHYNRTVSATYNTAKFPNGECPPEARPVEGQNVCSYSEELPRDVFLRLNDDKTLDFGIELAFPYDHSCTLYRRAQPVKGGWQYREDASKPRNHACTMNITQDAQGNIIFRADADANCSAYCGAKGSMEFMKIEPSMKQNPTPPLGEIFDSNLVLNP